MLPNIIAARREADEAVAAARKATASAARSIEDLRHDLWADAAALRAAATEAAKEKDRLVRGYVGASEARTIAALAAYAAAARDAARASLATARAVTPSTDAPARRAALARLEEARAMMDIAEPGWREPSSAAVTEPSAA